MMRVSVGRVVAVSSVVALIAHALLGWQWTLVGGAAAGYFVVSRAWLAGLLTGALSWSILLAYNLLEAPEEVRLMLSTMGGIFGGIPGWLLGAATVALGAVVSLAGALPAHALRRVLPERKAASTV